MQYTVESEIKNGELILDGIPLPDHTKVNVIILPNVTLNQFSFLDVQELMKDVEGNLSTDVQENRSDR